MSVYSDSSDSDIDCQNTIDDDASHDVIKAVGLRKRKKFVIDSSESDDSDYQIITRSKKFHADRMKLDIPALFRLYYNCDGSERNVIERKPKWKRISHTILIKSEVDESKSDDIADANTILKLPSEWETLFNSEELYETYSTDGKKSSYSETADHDEWEIVKNMIMEMEYDDIDDTPCFPKTVNSPPSIKHDSPKSLMAQDVHEENNAANTSGLMLQREHRSCAACGEQIADRYLLEVSGRAWHVACLRCCVCALQLDRQPSCFMRDHQIYCKQDYAKSFGAKCSKCCRGISSSDWVRRARSQVYHLACFACDACGRQLSTGEQFALHDDRVLCKPHYLDTLDGGSASSDDGCDPEGYHKNKAKRVRTTFTEEQLQVLQSNFQLDSNPDGQDLERIAQVTGLSKRVTQVWFQNSRARQKKHQHTGKGKGGQMMTRDGDAVGFGRHINLHLTYSFQNKPQFAPIDSSMDELSEDSTIHCMQSEV